jgi:DNA-binding transcriptional ArsR family regulator
MIFQDYTIILPNSKRVTFKQATDDYTLNATWDKPWPSRNALSNNSYFGSIEGSWGGINRGRVIEAIKEEPINANQLCNLLGVDYRTVRHHLDVMEKNRLITAVGDHYGKVYFHSQDLEQNYGDFEEIWNKIAKRLKNNGRN